MSNQAAVEILADTTLKFLNEIDRLQAANAQNLQFLNNIVRGWKDGTLTADRIQILDNGDMRLKAPEPPDKPACDEEVSKKLGSNGKGAAKDTNPLAEPVAAGLPEASDGN